jgi:tetratricopeptide (TPR) repeat protein
LSAQDSPELQIAYDKLNKRDFSGALKDFDKIINLKPDQINAICGRAEAKLGLGNFNEAMKDADAAINMDVNNALAYSVKGEIFFAQKDYENALKYYEESMQKPNSPMQAIIGKSKVLNQLGKIKEAFAMLDNAIESDPSSPNLYYARGLLNNIHKRYSKSVPDFDKAFSLNPNYNTFGLHLNRGIAFYNLEEYMNAITDFDEALELDPKNPTVYHSRGLAYYDFGNYDEAIEDFLKLNDLTPNNPVTLYNLGMAYYKNSDLENSCMYFHKSCQLKNTNACKMIVLNCTDVKKK